jgi:hypothetical protein
MPSWATATCHLYYVVGNRRQGCAEQSRKRHACAGVHTSGEHLDGRLLTLGAPAARPCIGPRHSNSADGDLPGIELATVVSADRHLKAGMNLSLVTRVLQTLGGQRCVSAS